MFKRNWKRTFLNVLDVLKLNITIFCFKWLKIKSFWPSSFSKFFFTKCDSPAGLHVSFSCKCCISMHHQHVSTRRHYSLFCLSTYWYHKCFAQLAGSSMFVINTCLSLRAWHHSSGLRYKLILMKKAFIL